MPVLTPVTVDYTKPWEDTVLRLAIKILKTAWEGKIIISNDACKIPQLYNAKKYISIYTYVHIHKFHS